MKQSPRFTFLMLSSHTSKSIEADESARIFLPLTTGFFICVTLHGCQNYILSFFPAVEHFQDTYRVLISCRWCDIDVLEGVFRMVGVVTLVMSLMTITLLSGVYVWSFSFSGVLLF